MNGWHWVLQADRTNLEGLKVLGLLTGDIDEMVEANLGALFMPHGEPLRPSGHTVSLMPPRPLLPC